jgi:hypothetical protein
MAAKMKRVSPLRARPLPQAGQSLDGRLDNLVADGFLPWLLAVAFLVLLAVLSWIYYLRGAPPSPWVFTAIAVAAVPFVSFRLRKLIKRARRIRLGRDGERMVAETLQELSQDGWRVFHDVPAHGFNIDHVAIGPGGILAIETKTFGKLPNGKSEIAVTEAGISIEGSAPSLSIISQATQQADWLGNELRRRSGKRFCVRPVVIFPGWFVRDFRSKKDPWVLERKAILGWIAREPKRLDSEQIRSISQSLDDYVRLAVERAEIARRKS